MRFLAGVGSSVRFQMMGRSEFLPASFTEEASLPCVDAAVFFQIGERSEKLLTIGHVAVERLPFNQEEMGEMFQN